MHYSVPATTHCDGCGGKGIGELHRRMMPDGGWKEDLVTPDGWAMLSFDPPPVHVVDVQRERVSALLPAQEIARRTNTTQPGLGCKACVAQVEKQAKRREERPIIEAASAFGGGKRA